MAAMKLQFRPTAPGSFRATLPRAVRRPVLVEVGLTLPAGYLENITVTHDAKIRRVRPPF